MPEGLVTVTSAGQVYIKAVAGCEGERAYALSLQIRALLSGPHTVLPSAEQVYGLARRIGFGMRDDLVVIAADELVYRGSVDLSPRYRSTFHLPRFNPRQSDGRIVHCELVEI